jgi:Fe-S-cluster containining protein
VSLDPNDLLNDFLRKVTETLTNGIEKALVQGAQPSNVFAVARTAAATHDNTIKGLEPMVPPLAHPLACVRGCAHCCHITVVTDVPTVLNLAEHIRAHFSADQREDLRRRMAKRIAAVDAMSNPDRVKARLPCPLLVDGACSVYDARPLICRSFNSFDAEACAREIMSGRPGVTIPSYDVPLRVGMAVAKGVEEGLVEAGQFDGGIELVRGLAIAMTEPDAARRWLAGEELFYPARVSIQPS